MKYNIQHVTSGREKRNDRNHGRVLQLHMMHNANDVSGFDGEGPARENVLPIRQMTEEGIRGTCMNGYAQQSIQGLQHP